MKRFLKHFAIATLALAGFAAVAGAQDAPNVIQNQRARVRQGIKDGSLTRAEATRLRREGKRLQRQAIRDRRDGAGLTKREAARTRATAKRESRAIARLRRNNRTR